MLGKGFKVSKCKTLLRLATARIKLIRNKRDSQVKQLRKDIAQLLTSGQEPSARIRVEHVIREENIMAAYDILELFCELIVVRLPIIDSQRLCPMDLKEAISSLIFASPRCADLPELLQIRTVFAAKYGKEFAAAACELRPDCAVNRRIIEKLSVRAPSGEVKLKLMKEIAAEYNVAWDPSGAEAELLLTPEDLLDGPSQFLGAHEMPLTPSGVGKLQVASSDARQEAKIEYSDVAAAAKAAADSANRAVAAACAAAELAKSFKSQANIGLLGNRDRRPDYTVASQDESSETDLDSDSDEGHRSHIVPPPPYPMSASKPVFDNYNSHKESQQSTHSRERFGDYDALDDSSLEKLGVDDKSSSFGANEYYYGKVTVEDPAGGDKKQYDSRSGKVRSSYDDSTRIGKSFADESRRLSTGHTTESKKQSPCSDTRRRMEYDQMTARFNALNPRR
ncbi:unnamed protein product [Sphagnum jensenii]|uniref:IST1-like protein n=1 Tax=Sphagnum jensenii TaxID=128206 RepID=A0ABP1BLZ5_9BRYO